MSAFTEPNVYVSRLEAQAGRNLERLERAAGRGLRAIDSPRVESVEQVSVAIVDSEGKQRKQSDVLVDIGRRHYLFHDPDRKAYAGVGRRVYAVDGRDYREVLVGEFYALTGKGTNRNAVGDAIATLASQAKFSGARHPVALRTGADGDNVVLFAGDDRVLIVSAAGVQEAQDSPVRFRRTSGMLELPQVGNPDFARLWNFLNVRVDHRPLVAGFMLAALRPCGPYPLLILEGEQGSGKSTATRILRRLIDPSTAPLRAPPGDVRDLLVGALNGWLLALDNLSYLTPQLSDALCRLATGGAISERALYTNTDEVLVEVQRPVIVNGIEDVATRPDLAERALHVELEVIEDRRSEAELWAAFDADAPAIFGALLQGLSASVRNLAQVNVGRLPRMADFAQWAAAGMEPLGFTADGFMACYRENLSVGLTAGIESSAIGRAAIDFVRQRHSWRGTATELLIELARIVDDSETRSQHWPKSPRGLAGALRRLAPSLRLAGVQVQTERDSSRERSRIIRLCSTRNEPSASSTSSAASDGSDGSDGTNRALHNGTERVFEGEI
ncbi:MAG: hypothetical protein JSR26_02645 [Proteobacteria bacterium]|nr:hypothetical protein [Pseudomonadota bacterium]